MIKCFQGQNKNLTTVKFYLKYRTKGYISSSKNKGLFPLFFVIPVFVILSGCHYKVGQMPRPEESGKIRMTAFLYSIEEDIRPDVSEEEMETKVINGFISVLSQKDIYEFVYRVDLDSVLLSGKPSLSQMTTNDYAVAKKIGGQAYLDYVVVITRSLSRVTGIHYELIMINVETGNTFKVSRRYALGKRRQDFWRDMFQGIYDELFSTAKKDLAAMAIGKKKGPMISLPVDKTVAKVEEERPPGVTKREEVQASRPKLSKTEEARPSFPADKIEKINLVVNDLKTMNLPPVIGLILAEHLRSELLKTHRFRIINRENVKEALKEMGFQMMGLVEESQVANAGKGLGARKIVSGNVAKLENYYALSLKLIDIETLETERMIFEKTPASSEENLFETIQLMAQKMSLDSK